MRKGVLSYLPRTVEEIDLSDPPEDVLEVETEEKFHSRYREIFYSDNRHERRRKAKARKQHLSRRKESRRNNGHS